MTSESERTLDESSTAAHPPMSSSGDAPSDQVAAQSVDYAAAWRTLRGWVAQAVDDPETNNTLDAGRMGVLMDQLENPPVSDAKVDLTT